METHAHMPKYSHYIANAITEHKFKIMIGLVCLISLAITLAILVPAISFHAAVICMILAIVSAMFGFAAIAVDHKELAFSLFVAGGMLFLPSALAVEAIFIWNTEFYTKPIKDTASQFITEKGAEVINETLQKTKKEFSNEIRTEVKQEINLAKEEIIKLFEPLTKNPFLFPPTNKNK